MKNIVVLISGNGSNLQAILDAQASGQISGKICGVISNKSEAFGLTRAKNAGVPQFVFERKNFASNLEMDLAISEQIEALNADLIVLAGYMKILSKDFVERFAGKILNIHPSLLPKYTGLHTHERAMEAGDTEHGMSIHFVNEILDGGAVVLQAKVPIFPDDEVEDVVERVQEQEHRCYPLVVEWFCRDRLKEIDGKAYLDGVLLPPQGYSSEDEE